MGKARRHCRHSTASAIPKTQYRELAEMARTFVVGNLLKATESPGQRRLNSRLMTIDPSGKLLCAYYQHMRNSVDHLLARKSSGTSEAEITAAFEHDLSLWLAKGPQRIIAEFDEQMESAAFGLPAGTPAH
jgi:hypothetical protein